MLTHGGDTVGFREKYGCDPLDFSVNGNPLGTPKAVIQTAVQALSRTGEYPDPLCRALVRAIAEREQVAKEWIVCGNGAADLIWRIPFAAVFRKALLVAPTFSEYADALSASGCKIEKYYLKPEKCLEPDEGILLAIREDTDLFFFCNPNNPTGLLADRELMSKLLRRCQKCGCLMVVDECFMDFVDEKSAFTMKPFLADYNKLVILKAFTKTYAMAGLRLGYCLCSDRALAERIRSFGQSWAVSVVAQEAGIAALRETDYLERTRIFLRTERDYMISRLQELGFKVYAGCANYLLFRSDLPQLDKRLAERGILIRNCENYDGLSKGYYRIAIRERADQDRLLYEIQRIQELSL